jgi:hypothetical protein
MTDDVLLRSIFYERDGQWFEARYYGRKIVWTGPAPVFFLNTYGWPRFFQKSPSLALVKEGPKALTISHHSD